MILDWRQLVLHYGSEIATFEPKFALAGQTTYGLLCCRFVVGEPRLIASAGEHAEQRLLATPDWTQSLPQALQNSVSLSSPMVTALILNRSPCKNCTRLLVDAAAKLSRAAPLCWHRNRFILACRGTYEDTEMLAATTMNDLRSLLNAGWELAALSLNGVLSARGEILRKGLENLGYRGIKRLES